MEYSSGDQLSVSSQAASATPHKTPTDSSINEELERLRRENDGIKDELNSIRTAINQSHLDQSTSQLNLSQLGDFSSPIRRDSPGVQSPGLKDQLYEAMRTKEGAEHEIKALKVQLKMAEEARDSSRRDLMEAHRKMRDIDDSRETMRKDNLNLKRLVKDMELEKQSLEKTVSDLKEKVKLVENEKSETKLAMEELENNFHVCEEGKNTLSNEFEDMRTRFNEVDTERQEIRRELQEALRQIKLLSGECLQGKRDTTDLRDRLEQEEARREDARQEMYSIKQNIIMIETDKEEAKQEAAKFQRRSKETEERFASKEKDYQGQIHELKQFEEKARRKIREMEDNLEKTTFDKENYKAQLSGSEGRIGALETHIGRLEGQKIDAEYKLSSLYSILRRSLGLRSYGHSPAKSEGSPKKPRMSFRSRQQRDTSSSEDSVDEIDPDQVKASLNELLQTLRESDRRGEEGQAKVEALQRVIEGMEEERVAAASRMRDLHGEINNLTQQKREVEDNFNNSQTSNTLQEEAMQKLDRDNGALTEKLQMLENTLSLSENERRMLQDKIRDLHDMETRLKEGNNALRNELEAAATARSKLELKLTALDGELQRVKRNNAEFEHEIKELRDRLGISTREKQDLQNRIVSLELTQEKLLAAITKAEEEEKRLKEKIQSLSVSLVDSNSSSQNLQDRISQLQRLLDNTDNEKKIKHESAMKYKESLKESKNENRALKEKLQFLEKSAEDADLRSSDVETQLKHARLVIQQRKEQEAELGARLREIEEERDAFKDQNNTLLRNNSSFEGEKRDLERANVRIAKDVSALKRTLDRLQKERLGFEESFYETTQEKEQLGRTLAEAHSENASLRDQMNTLQMIVRENEEKHLQTMAEMTSIQREHQASEAARAQTALEKSQRSAEKRERALKEQNDTLEKTVAILRRELKAERKERESQMSKAAMKSEEIRGVRTSIDKSLRNVEDDATNLRSMLGKSLRKIDKYTDANRRGEVPPTSTDTEQSTAEERQVNDEVATKRIRSPKRHSRSMSGNIRGRKSIGATSEVLTNGIDDSPMTNGHDPKLETSPVRRYRRSRKSVN